MLATICFSRLVANIVCIANWSGYGKEDEGDRGLKFACDDTFSGTSDAVFTHLFLLFGKLQPKDNGSNQKSDCVGNVIYETIIALCDL